LFGLQQSLSLQGKHEETKKVLEQWQQAWVYADIELTASHL